MAFTAGRTGYKQDISEAGWVTIFQSPTHGSELRGIGLLAAVQSIQIRITPLHYSDKAAGTLTFMTIDAGEYRERFSTLGKAGLINKVEAKSVVAGGQLTWDPVVDQH